MISVSVIEIDVAGMADTQMRHRIATSTGDLGQGRYVRLRVGATRPPLWVGDVCRPDLTWQLIGASERVLGEWEAALEGLKA